MTLPYGFHFKRNLHHEIQIFTYFWFLSIYDSLEQPTFGDATTGFHAKEKWAQKFHTDDARLPCSG